MSSEQSFSQADLRHSAQDYKRAYTHKHKWALGASEGVGRAAGKPRPHRPSETDYNFKRRTEKGAAVNSLAHGAKLSRKQDMLEGAAITDDSSGSNSDEYDETPVTPVDAGITYSFDAVRGPTKGSQILNTALAKAVEKFEERETVKLVKSDYAVLDSEGEVVVMSPEKKRKGKGKATEPVMIPEDEDYEFV